MFLNSLKERFEHESYETYAKMENILLTAINNEEVCKDGALLLRERYSGDIDVDSLMIEVLLLKELFKDVDVVCFNDVLNHLKTVSVESMLIPNVINVVMLLLVNPATSASAERSFSLARRLKTWERSTMTQKRFNSLASLQEHKERTDNIHLVSIGNEFISKCSNRQLNFGKFSTADFCN